MDFACRLCWQTRMRRNYISHVVFDHASVLALVQRKLNLPALTRRDGNGNDLLDLVDLEAMERGDDVSEC